MAFDLLEGSPHAQLLLDEGLPSGEGEAGLGGGEGVEQLRCFGADVEEEPIGPVAGVGLHQPGILARLQADPTGHDVGGFAGAEQGTAPEQLEVIGGGPLGELGGLGASGVVQGYVLLTLEAALVVVGGLAVAGEVDAAGAAPGQERSKRSRFMTLFQAAMKS